MNKEELFQELASRMSTGEINRQELVQRFIQTEGEKVEQSPKDSARFSVTKMLYVLGAIIVVLGIAFFVFQVWEDLGSFGRILVTLGLGLLLTAIGSYLLKTRPEDNNIGSVFHTIGGILIPGGAMVTLSELGIDMSSLWPTTATFGIILAFYLLLNFAHKSA